VNKSLIVGNKIKRLPFEFLIWLMIFIAAISLLLYCFFEIWHTQKAINHALNDWDKQHLSLVNLDGLVNEHIIPNQGISAVEDNELSSTALNLQEISAVAVEGEVIGKITLDKLHKSYPIIEGTAAAELAKGVGHYSASVLPGEQGNSILAGHRDSVFRKLGELKLDDQITLETLAGTFTYLVTGSKIVESDDTSVFLSGDSSTITLITCYPFHFVGNAPKRYLLFAKLVE
jgi:sortase A